MEVKLNVPKKYLERFACLEREYDLIDGCKYMLYFRDGWALADFTNAATSPNAVDSRKPIINANSDFVRVSILHFLFLVRLYHKI